MRYWATSFFRVSAWTVHPRVRGKRILAPDASTKIHVGGIVFHEGANVSILRH